MPGTRCASIASWDSINRALSGESAPGVNFHGTGRSLIKFGKTFKMSVSFYCRLFCTSLSLFFAGRHLQTWTKCTPQSIQPFSHLVTVHVSGVFRDFNELSTMTPPIPTQILDRPLHIISNTITTETTNGVSQSPIFFIFAKISTS